MPISRSAFATLLKPGLRAIFGRSIEISLEWVEEQDEMAILHPDTSAIPIWRRRPTRLEHPISAWRCWKIILRKDGYFLSSVAANCVWEGPVIRAHKRPVDPTYWDKERAESPGRHKTEEYYFEMHDTFETAGIHALKTKEGVLEAVGTYDAHCYGEVALYGRVAQFTLGYRAEACMIKKLYLLGEYCYVEFNARNDFRDHDLIVKKSADLVNDLSRRYGCEVELV